MANNSIDLKVVASIGETTVEFDYNVTTESLDDLKQTAVEEWNSENYDEEEEGSVEADVDTITLTVADWGETPAQVQELGDEFFEFCDAFSRSSYGVEVFAAALACDVQLSDIDEAYQGEFGDDEAFARETADQIGAIDKNARWPMSCIDWEQAAKELMMDYCSDNGHYFRNL